MRRDQKEVSATVTRDGRHVVLRLNRDNYRMNLAEAVRLADQLHDATEENT